MEMTKLIINADIKDLFESDKKKFVELQNILKEEVLYDTKYGIVIDNINSNNTNIEFSITVPEHSELKSDREFEMCGIYLANHFKTNITKVLEEINKIIGNMSKIPRIKVKYTSCIGSVLSVEDSEKAVETVKENSKTDPYFPFKEYEIY